MRLNTFHKLTAIISSRRIYMTDYIMNEDFDPEDLPNITFQLTPSGFEKVSSLLTDDYYSFDLPKDAMKYLISLLELPYEDAEKFTSSKLSQQLAVLSEHNEINVTVLMYSSEELTDEPSIIEYLPDGTINIDM